MNFVASYESEKKIFVFVRRVEHFHFHSWIILWLFFWYLDEKNIFIWFISQTFDNFFYKLLRVFRARALWLEDNLHIFFVNFKVKICDFIFSAILKHFFYKLVSPPFLYKKHFFSSLLNDGHCYSIKSHIDAWHF